MGKINNRTLAARKANTTRTARDNFMRRYGQDTTEVVVALSDGLSTAQVAQQTMLPRPVVGAIAANFTRGTYAEALRNCNVATW